jgi:hypothetical protein
MKRLLVVIPIVLAFVILSHYLLGLSAWGVRNWRHELAEAKLALALPQNPENRFYLLTKAQMEAFECEEFDLARSYAIEDLEMAPRFAHDWNYGNAIHNGHVVLGRLAVLHGDLETADRELLLAGQTPGSPQLDSFGPNMTLAKELLAHGQRQTVLNYFDECHMFWKYDWYKLAQWRFLVRLHLPPDFGANLVF